MEQQEPQSESLVYEENTRLRRELAELTDQRDRDISLYEHRIEKERSAGHAFAEQIEAKSAEVSGIKIKLTRLNRQLDEEVMRRDIAQTESVSLQSKLQDLSQDAPLPAARSRGISFEHEKRQSEDPSKGDQRSTKLMRVIENWMTHKDLQQALLRSAGINDMAFSTMVQVLASCNSLQTLDLSQNQLTMDSCSEVCNLITSAPHLSFVSVADNLFSLRSLGYFMTAVMERQSTKRLAPLDLLDLNGNEGLVAAAIAPPQEALVERVSEALDGMKLPARGVELVAQVMRALWRFLHDTGHPQVRSSQIDIISFDSMDRSTIRKMESALMKMLLLAEEPGENEPSATRSVTGDFIFATLPEIWESLDRIQMPKKPNKHGYVQLPSIDQMKGSNVEATVQMGRAVSQDNRQMKMMSHMDFHDPFRDLKASFEPVKEKLKSFNLKQIVTRNGSVLMNMLERLLDTTCIDAHDVETEQTLLEYACQTGNVPLAKLCYRRGTNLSAPTKKGSTPFNIVTKAKRYDMMEFLHIYGVHVDSADSSGQTALHVAAANNDIDGVCRLIEWGADVNLRDLRKRTPLHLCAAGGHKEVAMLLLEVGADMNPQDAKGYTPAAWAEARNHFKLMDRLVMLGGKGHGLSQKGSSLAMTSAGKSMGDVTSSPHLLKSTSLGRIGKIKVDGLPHSGKPPATKA